MRLLIVRTEQEMLMRFGTKALVTWKFLLIKVLCHEHMIKWERTAESKINSFATELNAEASKRMLQQNQSKWQSIIKIYQNIQQLFIAKFLRFLKAISLKVASNTFLLVCFLSLKENTSLLKFFSFSRKSNFMTSGNA